MVYTPYQDVGILPPSPEIMEPFIPPPILPSPKNVDAPPRLPDIIPGVITDRLSRGYAGHPDMLITMGPVGETVCIPNGGELLKHPDYYRHHPSYRDLPMFQRRSYRHAYPPVRMPALQLNGQLCHNMKDINAPYLVWDVIHPPQTARLRDRQYSRRWTMPDLNSVAINPSVRKVWVVSDHPVLSYWMSFWGPISIESDEMSVKDILEGIFSYLRTHLTDADLAHIRAIPGNRKALRFARAQRAKDSGEVDAVVLKQNYRRVDILGGHRQFQGMRIVVSPDNTWRLHLGLLPGPVPRIF